MPTTADTPKCFAEVAGRRLLDWALDAFRPSGVESVCFIGGYLIGSLSFARAVGRHTGAGALESIDVSLPGGSEIEYRGVSATSIAVVSSTSTSSSV